MVEPDAGEGQNVEGKVEMPNDAGGPVVTKFPEIFDADRVAAQKRLAVQLVSQMMADTREQRWVLRYMGQLVEWQEADQNGALAAGD